MLESLQIRNLALIKDLNIDFSKGLNVFSGETGAGKSLIINAIKLLFGKRASKNLIRSGNNQMEITALFDFDNFPFLAERVSSCLDQSGINLVEDEQLIIRRVISEVKSKNYINSVLVPLKVLDELGAMLLDVYAPGENFKLLQNTYQRSLLDKFANNEKQLQKVRNAYDLWQNKIQEKDDLLANIPNYSELEILKYQLDEIEQFNIDLEKDKNLVNEYNKVANSQDLLDICQKSIFSLNDSEQSLLQQVYSFSNSLNSLSSMDNNFYNQIINRVEAISDSISELINLFEQYQTKLDIRPETLNFLNERLSKLEELKKKFGPSVENILSYHKKSKEKIELGLSYEKRIKQIDAEIEELEKKYKKYCDELSVKRKSSSHTLSKNIINELCDLGFNNTLFKIIVSQQDYQRDGQDFVDFLISPNVGEEFASLKEIASSGEISRIMLAIKSATIGKDEIPIFIFDEIDANIGGVIGSKVAQKINSLACNKQIFSITHLAQVAAVGQQHYFVYKEVSKERTFCYTKKIEGSDRVKEISRMLGDTEHSVEEYAQKLLGISS